MIAVGRAVHRADGHELVHDLRAPRHVLGNVNARNVRGRGPMRSANLDRRVHLQVEHVLMRWRADEINHDDGLVRLANAGELLGLEQLRE